MSQKRLAHADEATSSVYRNSVFLILACFFAIFATKIAEFHNKSLSLFQIIQENQAHFWLLACPIAFVAASWITNQIYAENAHAALVRQAEPSGELRVDGFKKPMGRLWTGLLEALASMIAIAGGASIGREVPSIIIGISFFDEMHRKFRGKRSSSDAFSQRTAGAACGIAACFESPLIGISFVAEAFGNRFLKGLRQLTFITIILAGVVSQLMPIGIGLRTLTLDASIGARAFLMALFIGMLAGLSSWLFIFVTFALREFLPQNHRIKVFVIPALCGLGVAATTILFDQAPGPGFDLVNASTQDPAAIQHGTLFLGRLISALLTVAAGFNAWIMTPSMGIGYGLGAWVAEFFQFKEIVFCGVIGMGSYLAGVARAPMTSVLIVSIFAQSTSIVFPLLASCGLSYFVSKDCTNSAQRFVEFLRARNAR